jgi:fructose-1,6-bisphosphatase I
MIPTRTLTRVIQEQERLYPTRTGELSSLLSSIGLGIKILSSIVATAGFRGLYGYTGDTNVQGERVKKLDDQADRILVDILGTSGHFGLLVSEERDSEIETPSWSRDAHYVVAFDPLDGSSNIGSNIPVGTIFSIFRKLDNTRSASKEDFLQRGRSLVAAGYSVYGAKTSLVYSTGQGVMDFTLDSSIGEFVLTTERLVCPEVGNIVSVNDSNAPFWNQEVGEFVHKLKTVIGPSGVAPTCRYVGSLVADFDRTLRRGGIFLYPSSSKHPKGRLRLLYECMPLAFIMHHAGGTAIDDRHPILDKTPTSIHERSSFIAGSSKEVFRYLSTIPD